MSVEAQESRNKDNRRFRELFTRKNSRINTNADLLNRLLIASDPVTADMRKKGKSKRQTLSPQLLSLTWEDSDDAPNTPNSISSESDTDSDSTDIM